MDSNTFAPTARTLSFYTPDCLSIAATWHMADSDEMFLKYRLKGGEWITDTVAGEECSGDFVFRGVMRNLVPGGEYEYVIGRGDSVTDISRFRVRENGKSAVKFLYVTDSQEQEYPGRLFSATMNAAMSEHNPDFVLHGGDVVNLGGLEEHWSKMLDGAAPHLLSLPMMPAAGNHDYWDCYLFGYEHATHRHCTIDLSEQDTAHGIYYCFDYGPCRFIVLNSGDTVVTQGLCESQRQWLRKTLSECDSRWKIVMIHNPLYSPGKYGCQDPQNRPALVLRDQLNHMFEEFGVDLCLSGHDHIYSISHPIDGDGNVRLDCDTAELSSSGAVGKYLVKPHGTVHMIGGCAGDQAREPVLTKAKFINELSEFHKVIPGTASYSAMTVTENELIIEYYTVIDGVGRLTHRRGIIK